MDRDMVTTMLTSNHILLIHDPKISEAVMPGGPLTWCINLGVFYVI